MLNEEYYVALNRIFSIQQCRKNFLDMLLNMLQNNSDPSKNPIQQKQLVWVSRNCFQNLKHAMDLLLYES